MITLDGWSRYNIWEHSATVRELYDRRARKETEEMTCAAQAAELLAGVSHPGDTLLDVGCATGYFYHSLKDRGIELAYYGIDATAPFIEAGRSILPAYGLPAERLVLGRMEDMDGAFDHVLCMNVLSNCDNVHKLLERMLRMARKSVVLRESIKDGAEYAYVVDRFLEAEDPLKVHVNAYDRRELFEFIRAYGFEVREVTDRRTNGKSELVIGYPHYWTFLVAKRES